MGKNPLDGFGGTPAGKVTPDMLDELAARMNRAPFVIDRGWHYHVGQRFIDGVWKAELQRRDGIAASPPATAGSA